MSAAPGPQPAPALIWCPFPDRESAILAANSLLDERLAACANIVPDMLSLFAWQGERGEAKETGVLLKTNAALLEPAVARLAQLHPYDEPAIVGWRADAATAGTAAWLGGLLP
jgi:periplasmic divalent cation tolerance protein